MIAFYLFPPRRRHRPSLFEIIDHENQLVIVVAVENFGVDAGVGHAAGELAQLSGLGLIEALDQDVIDRVDFDASDFEGLTFSQNVRAPD
jgi:hypothetical protein